MQADPRYLSCLAGFDDEQLEGARVSDKFDRRFDDVMRDLARQLAYTPVEG